MTIGGNSKYGRKGNSMSNETKLKISTSVKKYLNENKHAFKGKKHTEESKKRMSQSAKGRKNSKEHILNFINSRIGLKYNKPIKPKKIKIDQSIKIHQLTIDGIFIKEWKSIMAAAKSLNLCRSGISRVCRGMFKKCGGYVWVYAN